MEQTNATKSAGSFFCASSYSHLLHAGFSLPRLGDQVRPANQLNMVKAVI